MFRIVKDSGVLDVNSAYSYLMWGKYFSETSCVALNDNKVIGFVSGFIQPEQTDTLFVWQIAIDSDFQGKGLATQLLEELLSQLKHKNINFLEATVTPTNIPSSKLFHKIANNHNTDCTIKTCFTKEQFPDKTTEEEQTHRIGPLK